MARLTLKLLVMAAIALLVIYATLAFVVAAERPRADFGLGDVMTAMARVPSSRAEFVETKTLALLAKPLVLTGTLRYERPGTLERIVRTPTEERMLVSGDQLTLESPAKQQKRTFALRSNPTMWAFVESIRATLAGDRATLERFYWTRVEGEAAAWVVNLEPRDSQMAEYVQQIRVFGGGDRVERIEVYESNGDRSVTRIKPLT